MSLVKQLLVIGCVFSACAKPPAHAKQAQDVTKAFVTNMEREKGLNSLGSGGFYTDKKIDSLYVDFEIKGQFSPEEAKALLTTTVNSLVDFVNQHDVPLRGFRVYSRVKCLKCPYECEFLKI